LIKDRIYDYYDNYLYGRVIYKPYLMAPVESYPVASFLYEPSEPVVNETVTFNASNSHDSDGSIVSYSWDFGDDTYANETEPITNHTYTIAGTYIVTLNATDNDGLTNIVPARDVISVGKLNSTISISASPTTLTIGENTTINGTVTPTREGAAVTIWYRYLGEGTWSDLTVIAANENSTYSYAWTPSEPGTYELKTSWLGDENTFGAESSTITVTRLSPPAPSFTYSPSNPSVGAEMSFDASSSYDVDGDIASYRWDFDDGNISSTVTPIMVHTYVFPRTYNVTLTVIDAAGLNSSIYQSVSVKMPTSVSVLTSSSSIFVGFKVNITGTLRDIYGNELRNETIVLSYTFSGIGTWVPITSDNTDSLGNYFAVWVPPATGYFEIKAEWSGNSSHFGVSNTIAVSTVPYENQYVFTVESNSTVSDLKFAQNSKHLSFSVSGENGTTGYTRVTIAKSLIVDVTEIKVNVDGVECNYTTIELDDSWVLTFTYNHSVHQIEVDMYAAIPEFSSLLPWLLLTAVTTLCVVCRVRRKLTY
jgi:PKD repeat protein